MAKPYSIDLRERVIAKKAEGKSVKEIESELGVAKSFIYDLMKLYSETGSIKPRSGTVGRKSAISIEELKQIEQEILKSPDITLQELKESLNLNVSLSTLCDAINYKLGLNHKKKHYLQ